MRQVVLDTETTGLEPGEGHRIIEIGCIELVNRRRTRRHFQRYVNPEREVDPGALQVHGLDSEFLSSQPKFDEVVDEFLDFVRGAELVIHNAGFDIAFIDAELKRLDGVHGPIADSCAILDTLSLARQMHPGQRNSLDALAKRYDVDNSKRELHGALLDAEILAEVYLAMTGGQVSLSLDAESSGEQEAGGGFAAVAREGLTLAVPKADAGELAAHEAMLARMRERSGGRVIWDGPGDTAGDGVGAVFNRDS